MPNQRIDKLELERRKGIGKARISMDQDLWVKIEDDFTRYSYEKFVTRYCQEQILGYYIEFLTKGSGEDVESETKEKSL